MTAALAPATAQALLAGNPGPPPSPVSVVLVITVLALVFTAFAAVAWSRRRREEPLRKEIRARPVVTFQARVDVKQNVLGMMASARGPLYLTVRGDAFGVAHPFPLARFLFGQDYSYRAADTAIKVVPGVWHDWIEIGGRPGTEAARIMIGRRNTNRQIWDALVYSGARPAGPPPPPRPTPADNRPSR
jgi:hypothetical protein